MENTDVGLVVSAASSVAGGSIGGYEEAGNSICSKSVRARTEVCQFELSVVLLEGDHPPS